MNRADHKINGKRFEYGSLVHQENIANESALELFRAFGAAVEQENAASRSHDINNADERFLGHFRVLHAREREKSCANKGKAERPGVSLPTAMLLEQDGDARSKGSDLGK